MSETKKNEQVIEISKEDNQHSDESCEKGHQHHGKHNHGLMMLLCCLAMFIAFAFLPRLGRPFSFLALLACPLMHIFMMKGMFGKDKS